MLLGLVAAACTAAPPSPPRTTLTVGLAGEPNSLFSEDRTAQFVAALVTEDLVRLDDKGELVPRLVETVPTLENGLARIAADELAPAGRLEVRFVLRAGVAWHDGAPITSDDIAFAWRQDLAAPVGSSARADAELIERVEAVDARTALVTLHPGVRTSRYAALVHVMPRHVLAGAKADATAAYAHAPMHAGPFTIASWQEGAGATLVPFARYALGKPQLSRIELRFFRDTESLIAALRAGEVELVPAGAVTADLGPMLERFAEGRGLLVRYTPQVWGDFTLFNFRTAYGDVRVRRALAAAIDRRAINQQVFGGRARIPTTYILAPSWAAADLGAAPDVDVAGATAALGAAGYCVKQPCAGQRTLRARIAVEGGSAPRIAAANLLAQDVRALGALASVAVYDQRAFAGVLASGDFDLALTARGGVDPADMTEQYVSRSRDNVTGYADPAFDALARSAAGYVTRAERRPLYLELQRIWSSALPALALYQELALDVVPAGLEAIAPTPWHGPLSWNAYAWRFTSP